MPLNWTPNLTTGHNFEAQVGEILWLEVASNDAREEWEWRAFDSKGDLIAGGTRGGRQDDAKSAAEQFAREWVAAQAAALGDGWTPITVRLPESDGWYHVAARDYKGRYPRHAIAQFTRDRFWIDGDNGEGDTVFAWRGSALPPLPEVR